MFCWNVKSFPLSFESGLLRSFLLLVFSNYAGLIALRKKLLRTFDQSLCLSTDASLKISWPAHPHTNQFLGINTSSGVKRTRIWIMGNMRALLKGNKTQCRKQSGVRGLLQSVYSLQPRRRRFHRKQGNWRTVKTGAKRKTREGQRGQMFVN